MYELLLRQVGIYAGDAAKLADVLAWHRGEVYRRVDRCTWRPLTLAALRKTCRHSDPPGWITDGKFALRDAKLVSQIAPGEMQRNVDRNVDNYAAALLSREVEVFAESSDGYCWVAATADPTRWDVFNGHLLATILARFPLTQARLHRELPVLVWSVEGSPRALLMGIGREAKQLPPPLVQV